MLKGPPFTHIYAQTFASLINDAVLKTMPDIDQALLQFIDVMNLLDPLLHFFTYFVVNRLRCVLLDDERSAEMKRGVSNSKRLSGNIALQEDEKTSDGSYT